MSLLAHLATIVDPRRDINKKHDLLDLLFLTVGGVLSRAESWKDIKDFGDEKLEWLRRYRPFENGIPVLTSAGDAGPVAGEGGAYHRGCDEYAEEDRAQDTRERRGLYVVAEG